MTQSYSICEPHPTVPSSRGRTAYLPSGRGGAGNIKRYNSSLLTPGATATGPASRTSLSPPPTTSSVSSLSSASSSSKCKTSGHSPASKFTASIPSGRGGAGNMHATPSQRAIFSFDEELRRDERARENLSRAPVYHIGRGGAGNAVNEMEPRGGRRDGAGSVSSGESGRSSSSGSWSAGSIFRSLSRTVSRESRGSR